MIYNNNLEDITSSTLVELQRENHISKIIIFMFGIIAIILATVLIIKNDKINELKCENDWLIEDYHELAHDQNRMIEIGEQITFKCAQEDLNDSTLYYYLKDMGAWYPEILVAQAKLESNNYTSNLYKTSNNLFGMKIVSYRNTVQTGYNGQYGAYKTWKLSCIDRIMWDEYQFQNHGGIPTKEEYYLNLLHFGYATDCQYIDKLKNIEKSLEK